MVIAGYSSKRLARGAVSHPLALTIMALLALGLVGCGDGNDSSNGAVAEQLPETERPELAVWTKPRSSGATGGGPIYDLAVADDGGEDPKVLVGQSLDGVAPQLFTRVSWSPDGRRIAFAGGKELNGGEFDDRTDVHVLDADGSNLERVTNVGDAADPVWSPNGEVIVFTRLRSEQQVVAGALWSARPDGSDLRQLSEFADWRMDFPGSFSPDGSRLAFTRAAFDPETFAQDSSIHVMGPDGSNEEELVEDASDPAFSPDGELLAFVSDRDENGALSYGDRGFFAGELYVAGADGSDPERLTETEGLNEAHPSWSPDGLRIAYQRGEQFQNAEAMSVLEINADGTCARVILEGSGPGAWYASPAWRPSQARVGGGPLAC